MGWSLLLCLSVAWLLHLTHNLISSPPLPSNLIGWRLLNLSQDVTKTQLEKKTTQRLNLQKQVIGRYTTQPLIDLSAKDLLSLGQCGLLGLRVFDSGRGDLILGLQPFAHWLFCSGSRERTDAPPKRISVFLPKRSVHHFLEILSIYKKRISLQVLRGPITEEHIWYWIPSWASHNNPPPPPYPPTLLRFSAACNLKQHVIPY